MMASGASPVDREAPERCPEPYSKDHKCAAKGVFLLELEDGEEDMLGDNIPNLEISLHDRPRLCYDATGSHGFG
jgi:hypothetical protein